MSPLLANIYLHYVLDAWFEEVVKPRLRGEAYEVRFADDFIFCFQYREEAEKVLEVLTKRFAKYGLTLYPEKTRLIEFGRKALAKSEGKRGKKPATFDFLGFTHICKRSPSGVLHDPRRDDAEAAQAEPESPLLLVSRAPARSGRGPV